MSTKRQPIKVYGELAKITLADSNSNPNTKTEAAKPKPKRRRQTVSQPTK